MSSLANVLEELAEEGKTQSEAARDLKISRQRVSDVALTHKIKFQRKSPNLQELICPKCKASRLLPPSEIARRKSSYCSRCHLVELGTQRKGVAASPLTKKQLKM